MYVEFIEGQKFASKIADSSPSHEPFKDAGKILDENDLVVDIDTLDRDKIDRILAIFDIKTQVVYTDRGCHLYFRKPTAWRGAKGVCPLGFEVEYKHISNTKAVTIKRNGVMREIINEGIREELPDCLSKKVRLISKLEGLQEGDGRNEKLHTHKMKIMRLKDYKKILQFINYNIFAEPLDEKELSVVIRDEKLKAEKDGEYELAMNLVAKYKIVMVGNLPFYYNGLKYTGDEGKFKNLVAKECAGMSTRYIKEVIEQMRYHLEARQLDETFDIKLANGILRDGEFLEVDSQEFTPYYIDVPYIHDAKPVEAVDRYLDHLTDGDAEYRTLLEEVLGHTLVTNKDFKRQLAKFFIFIGNGGNGKGTLLTIIRGILGKSNCSSMSPKEMTDERYLYSMKGKLANLGDDIDGEPINNNQMKILKNISTCDELAIRKLYGQAEDVTLTTSLIFTSNHMLKSFEKGESYKRRVMWLPMYGTISKKDKDFIRNITTKEAIEYWIKLMVEAYMRLYRNEVFTESMKVNKFNEDYHMENNGASIFVEDHEDWYFIGKTAPEIWEDFENWAQENDISSSKKMLYDSIEKIHNLKLKVVTNKSTRGKSKRVFQKNDV